MEKFLSEFGSIYWWISVVIVGLIINIIAGFGFKYINSFLDKFSVKRKAAKVEQELKQLERIKELKDNDVEKMIQSILILYLRMQVNTSLLIAVLYLLLILFLFSAGLNEKISKGTFMILLIPLFLILLFVMFKAIKYIRESKRENSILWKARKGNEENTTANI